MIPHKNQSLFLSLRERYPFFVFQKYEIRRSKESLELEFNFNLANEFYFRPYLRIPARRFYRWENIPDEVLANLAFHIGMVELVSYWKAACPPQIIIEAAQLEKWQLDWWKKLYFNGLGEFFYLNGIQAELEDFVQISSEGKPFKVASQLQLHDRYLVPVGGGKDSVVSLEILKKQSAGFIPFAVNPRPAIEKCIQVAGYGQDETAVVNRQLDPLLLELNEKGFLNGHTPFSALLAFVSALVAVGTESRYIALSNESSANEPTVAGTNINHQYSKSIEFENDFRNYCRKALHSGLDYFSLLRPLNELQIAHLFCKNNAYFPHFKSCNVGSKTDSWCCNCPKCLFTWIMLSPFLPQHELEMIFGHNLLEKRELKPVLQQLLGIADTKPFECVGTIDEVNAAHSLLVHTQTAKQLPGLLRGIGARYNPESAKLMIEKHLNAFDHDHHVPDNLLQTIKNSLK